MKSSRCDDRDNAPCHSAEGVSKMSKRGKSRENDKTKSQSKEGTSTVSSLMSDESDDEVFQTKKKTTKRTVTRSDSSKGVKDCVSKKAASAGKEINQPKSSATSSSSSERVIAQASSSKTVATSSAQSSSPRTKNSSVNEKPVSSTVSQKQSKQRPHRDTSSITLDTHTNHKSISDVCGSDRFCPICQVPLEILKISAAMHTASCSIQFHLPDCPDGRTCVNSNLFHYRDYSHHELAAYRDSENYVAPDVHFTPKKSKPKISPKKKPSTSKKRASKSPVASVSKKEKKDCLPVDKRSVSPDMFEDEGCVDDPPSGVTRKRLSFSEGGSRSTNSAAVAESPKGEASAVLLPVSVISETIQRLENTTSFQDCHTQPFPAPGNEVHPKQELPFVVTSEIHLRNEPQSTVDFQEDFQDLQTQLFPRVDEVNIKSEPLSGEAVNTDIQSPSFKCNMVLQYDIQPQGEEQRVDRLSTECTESCFQSTGKQDILSDPDENDVVNATCSFVIRSKGASHKEAVEKSPVSINFMLNNTGWEALEIRGKESAVVQTVKVSLCKCSKTVGVQCCITDPCISNSEMKSESVPNEMQEKFAATMEGLGLKRQHLGIQPLNQQVEDCISVLKKKTHQVSFTSFFKKNALDASSSGVPAADRTLQQDPYLGLQENLGESDVEYNPCLSEETSNASSSSSRSSTPSLVSSRPSTPVNLLKPLLRSRARSSSPSVSSNSLDSKTSRPSTPVPMVASRASPTSWTLRPAVNNTNGYQGGRGGKKVPPYKRIPDTQFVVDAFQYGVIPGVKVYFLSHFHADHYTGLRKGFNQPIFCSQVTANLVKLKLRVDEQYLHILKFGEPRMICGVEVDIFDANHCPGAVMFLFRLADGRVFLHVGDFRAHRTMEEYPQLRRIDKLFLDTTYCDPAYDFPPQEEVVQKVVETVQSHLQQNRLTLVVCGTYTIGKEKVFMGLANAFKWKIWTVPEKRRVFQCLENDDLLSRLTTDPLQAQVHVLGMRDIVFEKLQEHLKSHSCKYSHIVGFKPTGWTTSNSIKSKPGDFQKGTRGKVTIYGVPYSEHSSFSELQRFVRFTRPSDIQVTVNVGKHAQYKKLFQQWLSGSSSGMGQVSMRQFLAAPSEISSR